MQAGGSVFGRDASEGVDRDGGGGKTGAVKGFEPLARGDKSVCDGLLEDRTVQDDVWVIGAGLLDFREGVAGDGDDRCWEMGGRVELADLRGS